MSRTSLLIIFAAILAAAAAGILLYPNYLQPKGGSGTGTSAPTPPSPPVQPETDWIAKMAEYATGDGLVVTFSETDGAAWSVTQGHQFERFSVSGGGQVIARLSSASPLNLEDRLSGLRLKLPIEWAQKVNGQRFEIGVVARQPQSNAAIDFSFLYATLQEGNSGWRTYKLSRTFQVSKFNFDVPELPEGYTSAPMVIIRADAAGQNRAIELVGVYLKPVAR